MAFGIATVVTAVGKAITAARLIGATPAQAPPVYMGIGTGATGAARTAAAADTALSAAILTRVAGTASQVTTTGTNDTYQLAATFTATAAVAVDEAGIFDASTAGQMFMSMTFAQINLAISDTLTLTAKAQYT